MVMDDLSIYMAKRLRERRYQCGVSLKALGKVVGLTFQQVHKYEHGHVPMSVVQWYRFARALNVDPMYFVKGFRQTPRARLLSGDFILPDTSTARPSVQPIILQILLIDDDPSDAYLFKEALRLSGASAEVMVIPDGRDALLFLRDDERRKDMPYPHLIFLDLTISSLHGHSFLHTLKKDPLLCYMPVVILTQSIRYSDLVLSYHEQAAGYMCKPFDLQTFQIMMDACVQYWLPYAIMWQQHKQEEGEGNFSVY